MGGVIVTKREAERAVRRLERGGWAQVQVRVEVTGREAGQHGRTRRTYGITAVDPNTGYTAGPWWEA